MVFDSESHVDFLPKNSKKHAIPLPSPENIPLSSSDDLDSNDYVEETDVLLSEQTAPKRNKIRQSSFLNDLLGEQLNKNFKKKRQKPVQNS